MSALYTAAHHLPSRRAALATAGLLVGTLLSACGTNAAPATDTRSCADLAGMQIPAAAIGLPTSGGQVTATTVIAAKGDGAKAIPEYCRVDVALRPADHTAPDIKAAVALPTNWNGKAMMFGGGGYDGLIPGLEQNMQVGATDALTPLGRGYVTFASDSGHERGKDPSGGNSLVDATFALNEEALRNYQGDALKKTRDAAMFLINARYGKTPEHTFFAGSSTGGREALLVAQRWPTDFDGVESVAPAWNHGSILLDFGRLAQIFNRPGAWPNPAKQKLIYDAVINACDDLDGVRDGLVSNPAGCHFDPHVLRCPDGADTGDTCLSDAQITALIDASAPMKLNYPLASGETGYSGWPFLSGAPIHSKYGLGAKPPANPISQLYDTVVGVPIWQQWVRYVITKDPNFDSLTLDPQNPGKWHQRISEVTAQEDANNPDLSAFAKAGGKLLLVHGMADEFVSPLSTEEYWNRVQNTMGSATVSTFARFYEVPGFDHYTNSTPFTPGWDDLTVLENWVEHGQAPQKPIAADTTAGANRTRPLCEYPSWPKYNGTGDVNQAGNFTCSTR